MHKTVLQLFLLECGNVYNNIYIQLAINRRESHMSNTIKYDSYKYNARLTF